jgi:hypothetical protein
VFARIEDVTRDKLCPTCGAYWACDCPPPDEFAYVPVAGCEHDWAEAVGVENLDEPGAEDSHVFVCRLCGIYAVSDSNAGAWRR